jgi:hypothetical protein
VTKQVQVDAGFYSPPTVRMTGPGPQNWSWNGATESVTSTGLQNLFNSGVKSSGSYSFNFWGAGSYPYGSTAQLSQKGTVQVDVCSAQGSFKHGSLVYVEVQSSHHAHWLEDVEIKKPGASKWAWLHYGVATSYTSFTPATAGTYQVRSRLRRTTINRASEFSPAFSIKVK